MGFENDMEISAWENMGKVIHVCDSCGYENHEYGIHKEIFTVVSIEEDMEANSWRKLRRAIN